ncbi:MAG: CoA transferase [Alphaproteobacteria bacterium]|nr:CoA transferase [Alphaproteobacteria bacterium]
MSTLTPTPPPTAPLAGIRVIDFTTVIAGPYCTRLLSDCGAEVIKIETDVGDQIRHVPPISDGKSTYFGHLNAGKKSIVLDLRSDEGLAAAKKLVASADVVVENFRPGVMGRLGLDYATLAAGHEDLIYCAISGFGQTGPRAKEPAYAPVVQAGSGLDLAQMGYQDELTKPEACGIFTADVLSAVYAFGAIQTALISKFRHGTGQFIDVALMDAIINLLIYEVQLAQFPDTPPRILYSPSRTNDGFIIITPISQKQFVDFAAAIGQPELLDDPRFAVLADRRLHWPQVMEVIDAWTITRSAKECEAIMTEAGVPSSRYRTVGETMTDAQSQARGMMATIQDGAGGYQVPNPPFKFSDGTVGITPQVPGLGEHNDELLAELD